jgi:hypothetical protein
VTDALFDAEPYGPARPVRAVRQPPTEIRLQAPWMLVRHANGPPLAHLPGVWTSSPDDVKARQGGAVRTYCGRYGGALHVDGEPMALVCRACWSATNRR